VDFFKDSSSVPATEGHQINEIHGEQPAYLGLIRSMATLQFSPLRLSWHTRHNIPFAIVLIYLALLWPCGADTYTTAPIADAFVATGPTGNLSGDNFGAAGALSVGAGDLSQGEFQTVMQFNLSGAASAFNAEYGAGQPGTLELGMTRLAVLSRWRFTRRSH
jgi:hypothetical protein